MVRLSVIIVLGAIVAIVVSAQTDVDKKTGDTGVGKTVASDVKAAPKAPVLSEEEKAKAAVKAKVMEVRKKKNTPTKYEAGEKNNEMMDEKSEFLPVRKNICALSRKEPEMPYPLLSFCHRTNYNQCCLPV